MSTDETADKPPRKRRGLGLEIAIVTVLALAVLVPGIGSYSLVDPWETHYAEVARRMLQDDDWVKTDWQNEGFRSKPVLTFWLMAGSMDAFGVAENGGYAGQMTERKLTVFALRLPFALFGVMGLVLTWFMLARLISRRVAWLGLLVVGTTPFYLLVARQAITDMTLVACMMGAVAMFALATEDGDRPIETLGHLRIPRWRRSPRIPIDARHVVYFIAGGFVVVQAIYYAFYFARFGVAPGIKFAAPGIIIPLAMMVLLALQHTAPFRFVLGGEPSPDTRDLPKRLFGLSRVTTMRQVYMLGFYTLLGVSLLGKGLPALAIIGIVTFFWVLLLHRWVDLWDGRMEIKRGIFLMAAIVIPWHLAMGLRDPRFLGEYWNTHLWGRAVKGVFGDRGTFDYYLSQVGYGMFLWAALLPAAVIVFVRQTRIATPQGRVRFIIGIWAITSIAFFSLIQTKFHHYVLPAVPALGLMVAFWLDDAWAGRVRLHVAWVAVGVAIVLLLARDMMFEEKQWIEMFVFRYDRPWPTAEPWAIDASDGFLGLGIAGALAIVFHAILRGRLIGVAGLAGVAITGALWTIHVYMPIAGTHWGMRDAMHAYYKERQIHGQRLVYFGPRQLADDWAPVIDRATRGNRPGRWSFETVIPDHLQVGQPMTIRVQVNRVKEDRKTESDVSLVGPVVDIGEHTVTVEIPPGELAKLTPLVNAGRNAPRAQKRPVRVVDGDRLIVWQGYWRGEVFWSGNEVFGWLPEMQTDWQLTDGDSKKFKEYLNDRQKAPEGRRYFIITAGSLPSVRSLLPTPRARDTFEVVDQTSNKFGLGVFTL